MTTKTALLLFSLATFFSCKTIEKTIVIVDKEKTSTSEFKYVYEKNHAKDHDRYSKESLDNYLDLYINYRLKVIEAEAQNLDSSETFTTELDGYKKQLAKPYLTDDSVNEKLALEAYNRSKTAIKAQHILLRIEKSASSSDTLRVYNRLQTIKDSINKGADFSKMARRYSEDPSAKRPIGQPGAEGDLGYFSALKMVYPFENTAYSTKENEVSPIVRTKFGYHILLINDRIEMDYKVEAAHIMINAPSGISAEDSLMKKNKIDMIYQKLINGGDWDEICKQNSDHNKTKNEGGLLDPFTLGGALGLPTFESAAYDLQQVDQISEPIKTPYGWHIIKLNNKIPFLEYEIVKEDYIKKIARDARSQQSQIVLIERLKKENNFKEANSVSETLSSADYGSTSSTFYTKDLNQELFSINGIPYNLYKFNQYIELNYDKLKQGAVDYKINKLYKDFSSQSVIEYEEGLLDSKYEDYRMLVKEFHDGILIYDLMKVEVWDKANTDTIGLKACYEQNKEAYKKEKYIKASIYTINDIAIIPEVKKKLESGLTKERILALFNTTNKQQISVQSGVFLEGQNLVTDVATWDMNMKIELHEIDGVDYLISKEEVHTADYSTFEEVRGKVVSLYQKQLEENFIGNLKSKYPVDVNQEEYKALIKY